MDQALTPALFGFLGGVLGGVLGGWATIYVHWKSSKSLESDELRRKRIDIVYQLLGARYAFSKDHEATEQDAHDINTALSLFSVFFSDDKEIMQLYDRLKYEKSDGNLVALLQAAARKVGLVLLDSQIQRVMSIPPRYVQQKVEISLTGVDISPTRSKVKK